MARVVDVLGGSLTAEILGVSASQPSRWKSGRERVSEENLAKVIDLDYVLSRLLLLWEPAVIPHWLTGQNPHLVGRPLDVLRLRGARALLPAIDAEDAGAYA